MDILVPVVINLNHKAPDNVITSSSKVRKSISKCIVDNFIVMSMMPNTWNQHQLMIPTTLNIQYKLRMHIRVLELNVNYIHYMLL